MSQNDSKREVACTLTEEQEAERREDVRARLVEHYLKYEEHEHGVVVRFDGTDEALEALAEFTSNELQCCSFAEYEIAVSPPYEETVLTVTGPDGTTEMFQDGFVDRLDVESA
jgi:hypothetical protein